MKAKVTLCFTGHCILPTGEAFDRLKVNLRTCIQQAIADGYRIFLFGGCYGFDLLAAGEVLALRDCPPTPTQKLYLLPRPIKLHAIIPYEEQHIHWTEPQRDLYFDTMAHCDEVITLQNHFDSQCFTKRNQYMVIHSSRVISYWNGNPCSGTAQTIHMAEKAGLDIIRLWRGLTHSTRPWGNWMRELSLLCSAVQFNLQYSSPVV